jgi:hypothetical protein
MNLPQAVCNYAILQFLPYPETGEFVNVGVLVACQQPCLLQFRAEKELSARMKAMFPRVNEQGYASAMDALQMDMERAEGGVRDPQRCQFLFGELTRRRESTFRFGDVRTILTDDPQHLVVELFRRYVLMESTPPPKPTLATA